MVTKSILLLDYMCQSCWSSKNSPQNTYSSGCPKFWSMSDTTMCYVCAITFKPCHSNLRSSSFTFENGQLLEQRLFSVLWRPFPIVKQHVPIAGQVWVYLLPVAVNVQDISIPLTCLQYLLDPVTSPLTSPERTVKKNTLIVLWTNAQQVCDYSRPHCMLSLNGLLFSSFWRIFFTATLQ